MLVGDPTQWIEQFRSLDARFLDCVLAVWPMCLAVLPKKPDEDTITINLVNILSRDARARRLFHHLAYQHEPFGYTADGWAYSKGKIDMALLLDQERERYLAYECKRLNVVRNGTTRSLATPYVLEGMLRFITQQYAANLPVGCMLGYVLDGNVNTARTKVQAAIDTYKAEIGLMEEPTDVQPLGPVERLSSLHCRPSNGSEIEIRHALLPFPAA
ncbi:MAG: hypothetical protein OXG29_06155 [Gammaproteobacteria bacterium]|nr:hypothetical protein [Gammaproteobacteria bacterium]